MCNIWLQLVKEILSLYFNIKGKLLELHIHVPVAQSDRALVCGTKGCRFNSDQVRVVCVCMYGSDPDLSLKKI